MNEHGNGKSYAKASTNSSPTTSSIANSTANGQANCASSGGCDLESGSSQDNDPADGSLFESKKIHSCTKTAKECNKEAIKIAHQSIQTVSNKHENSKSNNNLNKANKKVKGNEKGKENKEKVKENRRKKGNKNKMDLYLIEKDDKDVENESVSLSSASSSDSSTSSSSARETPSESRSSSSSSSSGSSLSLSDNDDKEENGRVGDEDDDDPNKRNKQTNSSICQIRNKKKISSQFVRRLKKDYDGEVEKLANNALCLISEGSFLDFGFYQFLSFLFISILWTVANGWYAYVGVFSGYTPDHTCDLSSMPPNMTLNANDKECSAIDVYTNESMKCSKWIYDESQMRSTIISEYNFVCEKNYFFELAYSIEQIGYIIGTLMFSYIGDIVGRKPVLVGSLFAMSLFGLIQQYIKNFVIFIGLGVLINALASGIDAVSVTMILELFPTRKRTLFGIGVEIAWVIVLALLSPVAYYVKEWREIRFIIFIVLALLSLISKWSVQESIIWLISMSRIDKAKQVIDQMVRFNRLAQGRTKADLIKFKLRRMQIDSLLDQLNEYNKCLKDEEKLKRSKQLEDDQKSNQTTKTTLDLTPVNESQTNDKSSPSPTSTSEMTKEKSSANSNSITGILNQSKFRMYVFILALTWFTTALVYDGLTYMNNFIGENIFVNWVLMNLIELPAQFVCYLVISRFGRRMTISITLVLSGLILLFTFIEMLEMFQDAKWIKLVLFVLAKFVVTQSYSAIILHAPELFPTSIRSFGYGICLFSGKLTAIISPFISLYMSKIVPSLPPTVYGSVSIICGLVYLYLPETLNRSLPNSIEDVVKWPRTLSSEEWKAVKEMNRNEMNKLRCCKPRPESEENETKTISTSLTVSSLKAVENNSYSMSSFEQSKSDSKLPTSNKNLTDLNDAVLINDLNRIFDIQELYVEKNKLKIKRMKSDKIEQIEQCEERNEMAKVETPSSFVTIKTNKKSETLSSALSATNRSPSNGSSSSLETTTVQYSAIIKI
jgi:MFS family permease